MQPCGINNLFVNSSIHSLHDYPNMIEAINLSKSYKGGNGGIRDLNLSISGGQIFCLLGANGAGKTTTINLFLNFLQPTAGQALINGLDVSREGLKSKNYLAYIPENLQLYPNLSGLENLAYFSGIAGKDYEKEQLEGFLKEAGLQADAFSKRTQAYSKGMRQKVGIAIALAKQAKALLLDEPTSGLDPKASNEFAETLRQLKDKGVAILMATHDLFRARELSIRGWAKKCTTTTMMPVSALNSRMKFLDLISQKSCLKGRKRTSGRQKLPSLPFFFTR